LTETVIKTEHGAIIFDPDVIPSVSTDLFRPNSWSSASLVSGALRSAGRGNTFVVGDGKQEYVLRKYRRGGLIGKIITNVYCWAGEDETRSFAEWRLLAKLRARGVSVPTPAAARYRRTAMFYTADLLTVRIPGIRSLADRLLEAPGSIEFWQKLGAAIGHVHAAGIYHADLNAYNVQLDANDEMWLLDFDRGKLSPEGTWKQETLGRLHRSLKKIRLLSPRVNFVAANWEQFLEGYFSVSRAE